MELASLNIMCTVCVYMCVWREDDSEGVREQHREFDSEGVRKQHRDGG